MLEKKVKEVVSMQLDVNADDIKKNTSFIDDLGADSLAIVELVLALEEEFDIEIPDEDAGNIATFEDAVNYISKRI